MSGLDEKQWNQLSQLSDEDLDVLISGIIAEKAVRGFRGIDCRHGPMRNADTGAIICDVLLIIACGPKAPPLSKWVHDWMVSVDGEPITSRDCFSFGKSDPEPEGV
jgi:hypothetical protein